MSLDKYRNEICRCGSGKKFKRCCLAAHNQVQAKIETPLAKELIEKEQRHWKKRYDMVTGKTND